MCRRSSEQLDIISKPQLQYFWECITSAPTKCQHVQFRCYAESGSVALHFFFVRPWFDCGSFRGRCCAKIIFLSAIPEWIFTTRVYRSKTVTSFHCTSVSCLFLGAWVISQLNLFCFNRYPNWEQVKDYFYKAAAHSLQVGTLWQIDKSTDKSRSLHVGSKVTSLFVCLMTNVKAYSVCPKVNTDLRVVLKQPLKGNFTDF